MGTQRLSYSVFMRVQVDELSQGLVLVTQKMNERIMNVDAALKELTSSKGSVGKVGRLSLV